MIFSQLKKKITNISSTIEEMKYIRENVRPININCDSNNTIPDKLNEDIILKFEDEGMLSKISALKEHHKLFDFLRNDKNINTIAKENTYIRNGYYPTPDAETYAYMIATYKPEIIIEIGSGYSTLIAKKTIEFYGLKTKIKIIDPQPRTDISNYVDEKILKPVEQTNIIDLLKDECKTMIFIDSSHILRGGGDLPFLYNNLIPQLPKHYLVHVHDIFIPYDYPAIYYKWYYNEQYLLYALLTNTARYSIEMATHYLSRKYLKVFEECLNTNAITKYQSYGAALWFSIRG
jgi:hypothetical protein